MTTAAVDATLSPLRKAHRIAPHHHSKSHYVNQNRTNRKKTYENPTKQQKNKPGSHQHPKRQHSHQPRGSSKRQNSNPTPRKAKKPSAVKEEVVLDATDPETPHQQRQNLSSKGKNKHGNEKSRRTPRKTLRRPAVEEEVVLLDATDPEQAHRIRQRQKMISKGKNTVGYARYRFMVPLEERKPRTMTTPATPNPHVQMSTKRWQGLVRAWRIALHQYDPPELEQTLQHPPMLSVHDGDDDDNDEKNQSFCTAETEISDETGSASSTIEDAVFAGCQTPTRSKSLPAVTPGAETAITICDDDHCESDDDGVASSSVNSCSSSCSLEKPDTIRDVFNETSGIEALNRYDEEEITFSPEEPTQRPKLRTGASGWGDESSDEEDDDDLL